MSKKSDFNINIGASKGWFWGVVLILGAVMLIIDKLALMPSVFEGMTAWTLFLSIIMLGWFISRVIKGSFGTAIFPLAFLFMLTKEAIANETGIASIGEISGWMILLFAGLFAMGWTIFSSIPGGIISVAAFLLMLFKSWLAELLELPQLAQLSNWTILLCTMLIAFGFKMIFGNKDNYKPRFHKAVNFNHGNNSSSSSFGDHVRYIDCNGFTKANYSNSFGQTSIYFQNISLYKGGATLNISNSFGEMQIFVPDSWKISPDISNAFGDTRISDSGNPNGKILYIKGSNAFGETTIRRMHYDEEAEAEFEIVNEKNNDEWNDNESGADE